MSDATDQKIDTPQPEAATEESQAVEASIPAEAATESAVAPAPEAEPSAEPVAEAPTPEAIPAAEAPAPAAPSMEEELDEYAEIVKTRLKEGVEEASKQGSKEAVKTGIKIAVGSNIVWEGAKWVFNNVTGSRMDDQASEVESSSSFSGSAIDSGFTFNPVTLSPFDGLDSGRIIDAQASVDSSFQSTLHSANPTQQTHQDQFFQHHNDVLA